MKHKRIDTINVIPFIDIMLVLLVIVLTTATFLTPKQIPVNLPQAKEAQTKSKQNSHAIFIKKDGTLLYDKKALSLIGLKARLQDLSPNDPIELYSDAKSEFKDFVAVMELLTALKHKNLYIITKSE